MGFLRKITFPFSLLYALAVWLRNKAYDTGILRSRKYRTPSICVGNLSVGGTGKTPMIEWLIEHSPKGRKLAVLSRGYRRQTRGFILATGDSTAGEIGDEPLQLALKYPGVTVAVDEDRRQGMAALEAQAKPDLILLDDAFQHRRVQAKFSILLTACDQLYADDWYMPTGNLRDGRYSARRADLIVVTKCPEDLTKQQQETIRRKLAPAAGQKLLFSYLAYEHILHGTGESRSLESISGQPVTLVTGIAKPEPLLAYLRQKGIQVVHRRFRDHHFFTEQEVKEFNSLPFVLTTEKDYMRLRSRVEHLYYLGIRHCFLGEGESALEKILQGL